MPYERPKASLAHAKEAGCSHHGFISEIQPSYVVMTQMPVNCITIAGSGELRVLREDVYSGISFAPAPRGDLPLAACRNGQRAVG